MLVVNVSFQFVYFCSSFFFEQQKTKKKNERKNSKRTARQRFWLELLHSFRLKTRKIPYKIEREKGIYDNMCVCMRELDSWLRSAHEREHVLKGKKTQNVQKRREQKDRRISTRIVPSLSAPNEYILYSTNPHVRIYIIHIWLQERSIFEPNTRCFYSYIQAIMYVATKRSTVVAAAAAACLCTQCIYPFLTRTRDERSCVCSFEGTKSEMKYSRAKIH